MSVPHPVRPDATRWTRRWSAGLLIPWAAACAAAPTARPRAAAPAEVVDSAVATPPLDRTHWGIEVRDPGRGRALYRLNPEKHFVPASNMKLVVTAVALAELGPEYRYRTELFAPEVRDDSVAARLVVFGRGDPTLSARFFESDLAPVEALADSVYGAGIRRIEGELVVDASSFDPEWVHPTWEVGDLPWYYAAPVAAFAIAEAAAPMIVAPGATPGEPAVVSFPEPAEAFTVRNRLVTDTAGAETEVQARRPLGSYTLDLTGTIALDREPDTLWLAVVDPAAHAARALASALERRGVDIGGGIRVVYDSATAAGLLGPDTAAATPVVVWTSPPLREIVAGVLEPSQNWIAEQLLKTLGRAHRARLVAGRPRGRAPLPRRRRRDRFGRRRAGRRLRAFGPEPAHAPCDRTTPRPRPSPAVGRGVPFRTGGAG